MPARARTLRPDGEKASSAPDTTELLSDFTTRVSGKARWICSPRLSSFAVSSFGGIPSERSRVRARSSSTLPARLSFPTSSRAAMESAPPVALTMSSPCAPASAIVTSRVCACSACHWANGGVPCGSGSVRASVDSGSRVPMTTSCPSPFRRSAMARPTIPVPMMAIFMSVSFEVGEKVVRSAELAEAAGNPVGVRDRNDRSLVAATVRKGPVTVT